MLQPWEFVLIEWCVQQEAFGRWPTVPAQMEKATELVGQTIGKKYIQGLKKSVAYKEYAAAIRRDQLKAARKKLAADMPFYINSHRIGLEGVLANEDYRAVPSFTNAAIDRVMPKRDNIQQATAITINLSDHRQAMVDAEPIEIEYELIEDEDGEEETG